MIIEFNEHKSPSVKSIAVKSDTNINCTSRFMSGKMLMFAKLSLKSFIYSLVELLHFPEENPIVASIYEKYDIFVIKFWLTLTALLFNLLLCLNQQVHTQSAMWEIFYLKFFLKQRYEKDLTNPMNFGGALMFIRQIIKKCSVYTRLSTLMIHVM